MFLFVFNPGFYHVPYTTTTIIANIESLNIGPITFLKSIRCQQVDRESVKHIVLDCPDFMAKEIMVKMKRVLNMMVGRP